MAENHRVAGSIPRLSTKERADVAKLVDASVSGTDAFGRASSNLVIRTIIFGRLDRLPFSLNGCSMALPP